MNTAHVHQTIRADDDVVQLQARLRSRSFKRPLPFGATVAAAVSRGPRIDNGNTFEGDDDPSFDVETATGTFVTFEDDLSDLSDSESEGEESEDDEDAKHDESLSATVHAINEDCLHEAVMEDDTTVCATTVRMDAFEDDLYYLFMSEGKEAEDEEPRGDANDEEWLSALVVATDIDYFHEGLMDLEDVVNAGSDLDFDEYLSFLDDDDEPADAALGGSGSHDDGQLSTMSIGDRSAPAVPGTAFPTASCAFPTATWGS